MRASTGIFVGVRALFAPKRSVDFFRAATENRLTLAETDLPATIGNCLDPSPPGDFTGRHTFHAHLMGPDLVNSPNAVVLLSGGLDSATVLAIARQRGFTPCAMTFRYGQRHGIEIDAARRVAQRAGVTTQIVVDIDLRAFGGSALTSDLPVPKGRNPADMSTGIPITYVPARNTIFLSFALAWAEVLGATDIFAGMNAVDYSGYPDCRPEYLAAFEQMANLATKAGVEGAMRLKIHTPLITWSKAEIIRQGLALGVDFSETLSCYDPDISTGEACGECDSCQLRLKGFQDNGVPDPARYRKRP